MTTGYILIAAILILGGVIATVGDRIGTRVGKARLSLFKLRPKNTAVLITILTGGLISASTLAILFTADEGLRKGVFELEDIQKDLRHKREQLKTAEVQKSQIENQLAGARTEQAKAQQELQAINQSLQAVNKKQQVTQAQLNRTLSKQAQTQVQLQRTQNHLGQVVVRYQQAISELQSVSDQRQTLQTAVAQLKTERQNLYNEAKAAIETRDRQLASRKETIVQRDQKIAKLDQVIQSRNLEITKREQVIAKREILLQELSKQQESLELEVARLEKYYQSYRDLRLGKLALVRGQVLAAGIIRVEQASAARQAILRILHEADQNANTELTEPGAIQSKSELLHITQDRIEQLVKQINDGREYVLRIFSAGNYVRGEKQIEFFADAARNTRVFVAGEVLATTTADPKNMTSYQLRQRLDLLISASQFRARNAGIVEDVQIDGTFLRFMNQLRFYPQPVEIKAIATEDTYTVG